MHTFHLQLSVSEREDDNETTEIENLSASNNIKNQKKKKNKKKRRTGVKQRVSSEDIDGEDEITRTVKLVDKMFGTTQQSSASGALSKYENRSENVTPLQKSVLQVFHKNLNPHNELKRMFGKVVNQEQQKKRRGGNYRSLKPSLMTNPKDAWPNPNRSGIFMNYVNLAQNTDSSNKNLLYFTYEHSQSYRAVQQKFLQSVESIDSNNIVQIINMQPYHIDVSSLCRLSIMLTFYSLIHSSVGTYSTLRTLQAFRRQFDGSRAD